ncbi:DUF2232 domain-containing protein [Thermodesulforhabdus norvegica]|uniref:Uncharacterized conserved protein YybS, DUF2232 family n=1 Tax=Thermodesulforhabdus norvegica TaxID=39841 RepID=A0A1I4U8S3_9BACT|nr:DUF2232 domain-containing protein [Thermodesulforhabdus norvegica]SFM85398.1 Uncharacterized conserved protein YybS, DUF2232 family [Thermodesulforhabdus norvegica]
MFSYAPVTVQQVTIWIGLSLIFFGSAVWFPFVGLFLSFLTPIPSSLSVYTWGIPSGYVVPVGALICGGLLFGVLGFGQSLPYFALFLTLGALIGYFVRQGRSREFCVMAATAFVFAAGSLLFFLKHQGSDGSIFTRLEEKTFQYIMALLKDSGLEEAERPYIKEQIRQMVHMVVRLLPGASFGSLLISAVINIVGLERYSSQKGYPLPRWSKLALWKAPDWLVWPVIFSGFAALFAASLRAIAFNLIIVLGVIYLFHGMCILGFFAEKWKLSWWVKALAIFLIVTQQYLTLLVALTGFFDTWANFRKISKTGEETRDEGS